MKEPLWQKIRRALHGTIFFPHVKRDSAEGKWCTCGWREKQKRVCNCEPKPTTEQGYVADYCLKCEAEL